MFSGNQNTCLAADSQKLQPIYTDKTSLHKRLLYAYSSTYKAITTPFVTIILEILTKKQHFTLYYQ
jgi:hypothetical protein